METFITGVVVSLRKRKGWIDMLLDDIDDHDPRRLRVSFGGSWARKLRELTDGTTIRLMGPADAWIHPAASREAKWPSKRANFACRETRIVADDKISMEGTVLVWNEDEARAVSVDARAVEDSDGSVVLLDLKRARRSGKCNVLVRVLGTERKEDAVEVEIADSAGERAELVAFRNNLRVSVDDVVRCRRVEWNHDRGVFLGPPYASYLVVSPLEKEHRPAHPVSSFTPPSSEVIRAAEDLRPYPTLAEVRSRLYGRYRDGEVLRCAGARVTSFLPTLQQGGLKAKDGSWFFALTLEQNSTSLQVLVNTSISLLNPKNATTTTTKRDDDQRLAYDTLQRWVFERPENLVFHLDAIADPRDAYLKRAVLVDVTTTASPPRSRRRNETSDSPSGSAHGEMRDNKRPASAASTPVTKKTKGAPMTV